MVLLSPAIHIEYLSIIYSYGIFFSLKAVAALAVNQRDFEHLLGTPFAKEIVTITGDMVAEPSVPQLQETMMEFSTGMASAQQQSDDAGAEAPSTSESGSACHISHMDDLPDLPAETDQPTVSEEDAILGRRIFSPAHFIRILREMEQHICP